MNNLTSDINPSITFAIILLITALFARALLLPYPDLIDPTEARYACVAQEMVLSNDWLTPKLPLPGGVAPYLGKPPLHFWLTAISYKLFGIEEWSTRLPSFLTTILIIIGVFYFSKQFFNKEVALMSALIFFSTGMLFFLAGASVVDVTLTAFVTLATIQFYKFISDHRPQRWHVFAGSAAMALGFLCKGPIAIVLVSLPLVLWSLYYKEYSWLKRFPWMGSISIFFLIVTPWFVLSEIKNPGFIKYFFWNENAARYLLKDYGDKYGSGHKHYFGMSWLMLILAFLPWSVALFWAVLRNGIKKTYRWVSEDRNRTFVFFWSISSALFFTFVRQLHAMYILPSIPGFSILCACALASNNITSLESIYKNLSKSALWSTWLWVAILVAFSIYNFSIIPFLAGTAFCIAGTIILRKAIKFNGALGFVSTVSTILIFSYAVGAACAVPYLSGRTSSEEMLEVVADSGPSSHETPVIGVYTRNSFSHYWSANAWKNELSRKVEINYIYTGIPIPDNISHVLTKRFDKSAGIIKLDKNFAILKENPDWQLYIRIAF